MPEYLTVPEELVEHAGAAVEYFRSQSYRITHEPVDVDEYPVTPAFVARRGHTTIIVEVQGKLDLSRVVAWCMYARGCARDTRVCLVVKDSQKIKPDDERRLIELGVGLVLSGTTVFQRHSPKDQAVQMLLPPRADLPKKVKPQLSEAYDKFENGDWREGFRIACQVLEAQARKRIVDDFTAGKVSLVNPSGTPSRLTASTINRQTQGQLADTYSKVASPNSTYSVVEKALSRLNADRVGVVHHAEQRRTEAALRKNIGRNMLVVIKALSALAN